MGRTIEQYKNKLATVKGERNFLFKRKDELVVKIDDIEDQQKSLEVAQVFLQKVAKDTQDQLRFYIKDIVQLALDTCFPGEYEFDLKFEIKRGKTEARLYFLTGGEEIDPMDASGGGVVDIASFALRIAQWTLGTTRNTIVLDEPFKHLSDDLQPAGAEVLRELSDNLKLQFIIVTHREEITEQADKVFKVRRRIDGKYKRSVIKEM